MCYDIKTSLEKQLRRAILDGNVSQIQEINKKLKIFSPDQIELNHSSGFNHPQMIIYTNQNPAKPEIATWGLIPTWANTKELQNEIWNKTLNARGETIWKKPAFKEAAKHKRCLIFLEGFYEHKHVNGKKYPYFIHLKNADLFAVAGLWSEIIDIETGEVLKTFSIVTTKANKLMAEIHNNPKLPEPRMPLVLPNGLEDKWLLDVDSPENKDIIKHLIKPLAENELQAYTVAPLKGNNALGNVKEASNKFEYPELKTIQGSLF